MISASQGSSKESIKLYLIYIVSPCLTRLLIGFPSWYTLYKNLVFTMNHEHLKFHLPLLQKKKKKKNKQTDTHMRLLLIFFWSNFLTISLSLTSSFLATLATLHSLILQNYFYLRAFELVVPLSCKLLPSDINTVYPPTSFRFLLKPYDVSESFCDLAI